MRRLGIAFGLALIGAAACATESEEPQPEAPADVVAHNSLTAEEQAAGWKLLFDGVSTSGWKGYGRDDFPSGGWMVENGELVGLSTTGDMDGGDIVTVDAYADFELVFDFKLGPATNSGVFYRVAEQEGAALWEVAPEFQVLDDTAYFAPGTDDGRTHRTGDNYDLHEATTRPTRDLGEWNTARIVVEGTRVEHWLNGEQTVAYDYYSDEWESLVEASKFDSALYGRAPSGSIGLQDHGTPVWYRNIKIRPIQ
ncbi:MAG: DUF1080 domain-containing protein [Gemmatimonadota bacterium]